MARMILETLGLLTVIAAIVMVVVARGAIHEATAAIAWVGGWLMFAASVIIGRMDAARNGKAEAGVE